MADYPKFEWQFNFNDVSTQSLQLTQLSPTIQTRVDADVPVNTLSLTLDQKTDITLTTNEIQVETLSLTLSEHSPSLTYDCTLEQDAQNITASLHTLTIRIDKLTEIEETLELNLSQKEPEIIIDCDVALDTLTLTLTKHNPTIQGADSTIPATLELYMFSYEPTIHTTGALEIPVLELNATLHEPTISLTETVDGIEVFIDGKQHIETESIVIKKNTDEINSSGEFTIVFDNYNGKYTDIFELNSDVEIYYYTPTKQKLFKGVIENVDYSGRETDEKITITGRDYSTLFHDIIVRPRIFKNDETSIILKNLMMQNGRGLGIDYDEYISETDTIIPKITFNNISLYDAFKQLADIAGYYFYVDVNKKLHFEKKGSVVSGQVFNNTNVIDSKFKESDRDIFNYINVFGDRQLTGLREEFGPQAGSVYALVDRPHSVRMIGSPDTLIQPGGILNVSDPNTEDVKFLVDYQSSRVVLTSGTIAGDNTGWAGSTVYIDYDRSVPIIAIRTDNASAAKYGKKIKNVYDKNIKDLDEAIVKANHLLSEHVDAKMQGTLSLHNVINIIPGTVCTVDMPFHNIPSQHFSVISATYTFNPRTIHSNRILTIQVSKKLKDLADAIKNHEMRLRKLESDDASNFITTVETSLGSIGVSNEFTVIQRSIGSAFYFHIPNHNQLNSPSSLLGDMRGGSIVITG